MLLTKLFIVRCDEVIYSLAYDKDKLVYFLSDSCLMPATEAVFIAKATRVNYKAHTAFVDCSSGLSGFINLNSQQNIQDGSILPVQLVWHGDDQKQAKFRTTVQLAGKYVVYTGTGRLSISSKKLAPGKLEQLRNQIADLSGKWVLRSCVRNDTDLALPIQEMRLLSADIESCHQSNGIGQSGAGVKNYLKLLRSLPLAENCEVLTNDQDICDEILAWQNLWQIDVVSFDSNLNLTTEINQYREEQLTPLVRLNNGASIELATLNGIHVIDINSSRANLASSQLNYIVLDEVYRQICLRNFQGIILVDFIKNTPDNEQTKLINQLQKLFNNDVTSTKVLGFSHAGLCEIIRNKF